MSLKTRIAFICCIAGISLSFSQTQPIWHYIENEQVISENKLDAHATFSSYTNKEDAIKEST